MTDTTVLPEDKQAASAPVERTSEQGKGGWRPVGTVVGNAGTSEFTFILERFRGTVGDIIAVPLEVPTPAGGRRNIMVWARITDINRFNPFFPYEAAHELANEGMDLLDTVLSNSRDQLEAQALILGCTESRDFTKLSPLNYPVQPASRVYHPPSEAVGQLLIGERANEVDLEIGTLLARPDVTVGISARRLVSRHLAILAMTGGGKTVAARRIIRALSDVRYPMVILDPHGDYVGLWRCKDLFKGVEIKLFYPELTVTEDGEGIIFRLIEQMTQGLTEPQIDLLGQVIAKNKAVAGTSAFDYCTTLKNKLIKMDVEGRKEGTKWAVVRALNIVINRLARMSASNDLMRKRLKALSFEPLPNPVSEPDKIVRPGQISIIYLGGYDHITQCSIAAIAFDSLFDHRASLSGMIPPFMGIVEEAHTFIPSAREGTSEAVSLPVIRRIITEGRKFGAGLVLISQRPSRIDETIISQCNSFLVLRLVNPRDQTYVQNIMENLSKSDARMLPGFGPGQGIVSGQVVRFPLPVQIKMDSELLAAEIGDEDFIQQVSGWKPDKAAPERDRNRERIDKIKEAAARRGFKRRL
jgi:DNA helicase HerA-like ATPase